MPVVRSKRYTEASKDFDRGTAFEIEEAVRLVKEKATAKFDESIELAIKLDIDTKQSDQLVRGSLSLPHGIGKSVRVIAFAEGDDADAARAAGAIEVGGQDLAEKITGGWMDFDVAIAHPKMMRFIGKLGKVLGPKGLMPSPKSGTVTERVGEAVTDFAAGKIEFRNDKEGNVNLLVGKASFDQDKLVENVTAAVNHISSIRPSAVKGDYITGVFLCSTMGPGVRLAVSA